MFLPIAGRRVQAFQDLVEFLRVSARRYARPRSQGRMSRQGMWSTTGSDLTGFMMPEVIASA